MRFIVPVVLALAGGLLGGLILWYVVGIVGALAADHPSGALAAPLVLLMSFVGAAAWRVWRQHTG
jgi:hypothetical protein